MQELFYAVAFIAIVSVGATHLVNFMIGGYLPFMKGFVSTTLQSLFLVLFLATPVTIALLEVSLIRNYYLLTIPGYISIIGAVSIFRKKLIR